MERFRRWTAVATAVLVLLAVPMRAFAATTVSAWSFSCTQFSATGTNTTSSFTSFEWVDNTTNESWFGAVTGGGSFSFSYPVPGVHGHSYGLYVYGSDAAGNWDGQDYFFTIAVCSEPIPASTPLTLALTALLLAGSVALVNSRRRGSGLRRRP